MKKNRVIQTMETQQMSDQQYLTEKQVSKMIGRAVQSLRNDRFNRKNIPYIKLGSSVRYDLDDVIEFMKKRKIYPDQ